MPRTISHLIILAFLAIFMSACTSKPASSPIVNTPQGPVQGIVSDKNVMQFNGIPYAAPPVGDLRWRAPQSAQTWSDVRDATTFSAMCMQDTSTSGLLLDRIITGSGVSGIKRTLINRVASNLPTSEVSEDCLYLNVRTPNITTDGDVGGELLPVMMWIHGGGHQFGSGDTVLYQGDDLPRRGVVLVTLNYRLGAFGYMAHPALSKDDPRGVSGNYGTLDQIAALKWVRDNISAYGGDPDNVTIFGESAGAWSVTEMMTSPLAAGLFHKAIGQSGAATYHLGALADAPEGGTSSYAAATDLVQALGLSDPTAEDLRAVAASDILDVLSEDITDAFHHTRDGVVFPQNVGTAFLTGNINPVPILFGYNTDEGTLFYETDPDPSVWIKIFPTESHAAMRRAMIPHYGESATDTLLEAYNLSDPQSYDAEGIAMAGDEVFGMNVRFVTRRVEELGQPSYLYIFGRVPPSSKQTLGATHAAEIPFIFGTHFKILGFSKSDAELTELMQAYWVNFARTGNPNADGLPNWPEYQGQNWMQFGGNNDLKTGAITEFRKTKLDALEVGLMRKLEILSATPVPDNTGSQNAPETEPETVPANIVD